MNYSEHQKSQHSKHSQYQIFTSIKCYFIATIHPVFFITIFWYISRTKQTNFRMNLQIGLFGQASKSQEKYKHLRF